MFAKFFSGLGLRAVVAATAATAITIAAPAMAHEFKVGDIVIEHPYANATPPGAKNGGVFFEGIKNNGTQADRLLSASSDVAASVAIHTMTMDNNVMRMREVEGIDLPAGSTTNFGRQSKMGYHLMVMGLKAPLKEGDSFKMTLKFQKAGDKEVTVSVQKKTEGMHEHMH